MATDILTNFTQTTIFSTPQTKSNGIIEYHSKVFLHAPENLPKSTSTLNTDLHIPVIDFKDMNSPNKRSEIIKEISEASKSWGVFQLLNHGMPINVLDGMAQSVKKFHEKEQEGKAKNSSNNFSDMLSCFFDDPVNPDDLPEIRQRRRLQKHAPSSIQVGPTSSADVAGWNVAIPLLSPLDVASLPDRRDPAPANGSEHSKEESQPSVEAERKKWDAWRHPAEPLCYEPVKGNGPKMLFPRCA